MVVRSIFEDVFFDDFHKHFAGNKLSFGHELANLGGFLAIGFDEFAEEIAGGEVIEAVLFDHVGTLCPLAGAGAAHEADHGLVCWF